MFCLVLLSFDQYSNAMINYHQLSIPKNFLRCILEILLLLY